MSEENNPSPEIPKPEQIWQWVTQYWWVIVIIVLLIVILAVSVRRRR